MNNERSGMSAMKHIAVISYAVLVTFLKSAADAAYVSFPSSSSRDTVAAAAAASDVTQFHRLAVDPVSGTVFVGARNRLHQLNADLQPVRTVVTGPRLDNRLCTESFGAARCGAGGTTAYDARLTDNINKVLT